MGNEAFENALFVNALFGNGNKDYSCLWAVSSLKGWKYSNFFFQNAPLCSSIVSVATKVALGHSLCRESIV